MTNSEIHAKLDAMLTDDIPAVLTPDENRQIVLLVSYFREGIITSTECGEWFTQIISGRVVFPAFDSSDLH